MIQLCKFVIFSLLMCQISSMTRASKVILKDNGYEGVVAAIQDDLPVTYCQEIILGLETLIRESSKIVFKTTRKRASFRDVTILVPSSWTPSLCPLLQGRLGDASGESWNAADLRITRARHPVHGPRPWALQSKGCAQEGDYISVGHEILFQNQTELNGRLLAHAWLKYRYGVFEEIGIEGSTTHPTTYRNPVGEWVATACTKIPLKSVEACGSKDTSCSESLPTAPDREDVRESFMAFPEAKSVTELCDEGTHNSFAPTPHNLICGAKSVWEVLRVSPDFQSNRNVEGMASSGDVRFQFVRPKNPRMVLLVEDTNVMNVQKRWDFMRKAVRKLVNYDVPDGFSVGLVVFDSIASVKYPLKPLTDDGTRFNIGSSLPRNPSTIDKHRRCVICGLEESVTLLRENGGTAGGHVVLMLAGSDHIDPNELNRIEKLLEGTNIILHVIVYPMTEKFPKPGSGIKAIGSRTGGSTFTIADEGIGADSKIVMYYNLLDSLYHTLSEAAGEDVLPVKVLSAEHVGGLLQSEGSFWVDPGLGSDTIFAVFYYDLAHVGDTIHLISPLGQVIDTGNMQTEDDNMNMLTIRLRKNQEAHGLWHYRLENRADSHQALYVQVTSRPQKDPDATRIKVRAWTNHKEGQINLTDIANPLIMFAEVRDGLAPIEEAKVTAVLKKLGVTENGTEHSPIGIALYDNGLIGPDIKRGDGVYSRFAHGLDSGKYTATVHVEGEVNGHTFTRYLRLGILDVYGSADDHRDVIPPARITNLRAAYLPGTNGQVTFAWTAPGGDYDYGRADMYKVLVNNDIIRLRDELGEILEGWPEPLPSLSIQSHTMTWGEYDTVFYLGIYAVDSSNNAAILSNIVQIYVPAPQTLSPATIVTLPNLHRSSQDLNATGAPILSGFDATQLIIVLLCVAGVVFVCFLFICYCYTSKKKSKNSRSEKIQEPKDGFNVTVTVGNKGSDFSQEKLTDSHKKDYLRPINSWSPTELLGSHQDKRCSISGRSDNNSDHSGSTKKSFGGSSDPPQYYSNGVQYSYEGNSYNDAFPIPSDGYPTPVEGYPQSSASYPSPTEGYVVDGYPTGQEIRSYVSSQPSDSFMSESCDMLPGTQGPPGYSAYPPYDHALRVNGGKVPPPIPPKPKVQYTPEPYLFDGQDTAGTNSSNASVTSEKRVRNVTMV